MKQKIIEVIRKIEKIEPYYFYFFLLINLIPVLSYKFFPTVDGPAHLYNSNIIVNLIKGNTSNLSDFFILNNNINPNWSGHFLLSVFLSVFPAFIAEKIVLLIYLIGLPLSVRYLFKVTLIKKKYLIYLIFPFTYSFLFYYGFYNFNIALVLYILGICYCIKHQNNFNIYRVIGLTIFSSLILLSHLFVFALFGLTVVILNVNNLFILKATPNFHLKHYLKQILLQVIPLVVCGLCMLNYFIHSQVNNSVSVYLQFNNITESIINIMPAKGINYGRAAIFTKWLFFIFTAFILYFIIIKLFSYKLKKKIVFEKNIWLLLTLATLLFIYILPDSKGVAIGFITSRFILFFFIFFIFWLASQEVATWFKVLIFVVINYTNCALLLHNYNSSKKGCELAEEIYKSSSYIKPNATVLPILNSDYFIYGHISNYLGVDKPLIILENYEASLNHFPLKWNNNKQLNLNFNSSNRNNCEDLMNLKNNKEIIDYVVVINEEKQLLNETCSTKIDNFLILNYTLLYKSTSNKVQLYKSNAFKL